VLLLAVEVVDIPASHATNRWICIKRTETFQPVLMRFRVIVQKCDHIAGAILDSLPDWRKKPGLIDLDEAQKVAT
jgi:hypothetical protein